MYRTYLFIFFFFFFLLHVLCIAKNKVLSLYQKILNMNCLSTVHINKLLDALLYDNTFINKIKINIVKKQVKLFIKSDNIKVLTYLFEIISNNNINITVRFESYYNCIT